jgi:hypothetical protein
MRAHVGRLVLILCVVALVGCATTGPTPKTASDVRALAGTWYGWVGCREGCARLNATLTVQDDGRWAATVESNPTYYGQFGIVDGALHHGRPGRWYGRVNLAEGGNREWLTIFHLNGNVWGEFDRAKEQAR